MANTAARVGSINVLLSTQLGGAVTGLNAFADHVERTGGRVAGTVRGIDRSTNSLNRTMASINPRGLQHLTVAALRARTGLDQLRGLALATTAAFTGILPAGIAAGFVQVADRAHRMDNSLRTVTSSTADLKNLQEELFQASQRSRSGFESTVTLYARTARATEHLGLSQQKLIKITETVQKAFAIGGASPQEAQGAAIQLSQGIASDRLGGEEFRSVAENAPVLLQAMGKSLGVTIGQLREMAHAGELTAAVVTKAILDSNAEIEAAYAKTSSTIMQAVQMVDNELLRFVSNSSSAAAASTAIVGILNVLGDNIDNIALILTLLAARWGAAFGARQISAVAGMGAAWRQQRLDAFKAAQEANALAQAHHLSTQQTLASTRAAYEMSKANTVSASTRARLGRELQVAARTELMARNAAIQSAAAYSAATAAAGRYGTALSALSAAGRGLLGLVGGPLGAGLLALGGIMYFTQQRAQAAQERADHYADAIKLAGENSAYASGGVRQAAEEMFGLSKAASSAAASVYAAQAEGRKVAALNSIFANVEQAAIRGGWAFMEQGLALRALYDEFAAGRLSAEEFVAKTDEIARKSPGFVQPFIAGMQDAARQADAARGEIAAVEAQIAALDGKRADITITVGTRHVTLTDEGVGVKGDRIDPSLSDDAFNSRFGRRYAKSWEDLFPGYFKKEKAQRAPRKTADDQFSNSVQGIRDRIAAMREEVAVLGLSHQEEERRKIALDLEQEALKQVREEARKKGDQDWQNAQLGPEQARVIGEVSVAYAAQAEALRRATEQSEFYQDLLDAGKDGVRGIIDALVEGTSVTEAFANSLKRVGDTLINNVLDGIFKVKSAGSGGGGGFFGFLGSLFGFGGGGSGAGLNFFPAAPSLFGAGLFDSGGTLLPSGIVPFGPKTKTIGAGILGDSGFGPRHFPAVLKYGETVLDEHDTGRNIDFVTGAAEALKDGGGSMSFNFAPTYQVTGSGPEIAALRAQMEKDKRDFAKNVIETVQGARRRRVPI